MTLTKKTKKILLIILACILALSILAGVALLWIPGFWHSIQFFPQYKDLFDSPITQITLWDLGDEVTFTDQDLIDRWEEGLEQVKLQKTELSIPLGPVGSNQNYIFLQTAEGKEYTIRFWQDKVLMGPFGFTPNDWNNLPFEETFDIARQRHGLD